MVNTHLQAKRRMTKSTVVDNETGKSVDSTVRTSTGSFYGRGEDEVRLALTSLVPIGVADRGDCA